MSKKVGLITSWSLSRLRDWQRCPAYAKYKHVERRPAPSGDAANRGTEIHTQAEMFVASRVDKLAGELGKMKKRFLELRQDAKKRKVTTEWNLAFDSSWRAVEWFAKDAWVRIKIDAVHRLPKLWKIIDYKTGQIKDSGEYDDQLELYALGALVFAPDLEKAQGELWFTDHNKVVTRPAGIRTQKDVVVLKKKWEHEVEPMLKDRIFPTRPGRHCSWCPFSKMKGGPCKF